MSGLANYWKVLLAILLLIAAVLVLLLFYFPAKDSFEQQVKNLGSSIAVLEMQDQAQKETNKTLEAIKDKVGPAKDAVEAADEQLASDREILYGSFPGGLYAEDQILYVMDLENMLDMEIMFGRTYDSRSAGQGQDTVFTFGQPVPIAMLTDNSVLCSVNIKIDFDMEYQAFKNMLTYLANDKRITSINYSKIDYDPANNKVVGYATLQYYYLDSNMVPYEEPVIEGHESGKTDLFN